MTILIVEANSLMAQHYEENLLSRTPKPKVLKAETRERGLEMLASNEDISQVVVAGVLRTRDDVLQDLGDTHRHR